MSAIKITTPAGQPVEQAASHPGFRDITTAHSLVDSGAAEVTIDEFLREEHHNYYGGPWSMGRFIFDRMVERGLEPRHTVLDLGCGAGRIGIWLAEYLNAGHYCGVDVHYRSLAAFARYEIPLHRLESRRPRLILDGEFNFADLGERFDFVLDCSVTAHLTRDQAMAAYRAIATVLKPEGRVLQHHLPKLSVEDLSACGFQLAYSGSLHYPLMDGSKRWKSSVSSWAELARSDSASTAASLGGKI